MPAKFDSFIIDPSYKDYVLFDRTDKEGEEVYVVAKNGKIEKTNTKMRFQLPLVPFDHNFITAMNQIVIDRYESGTIFKMIVEKSDDKQKSRVGFFSIINIE